MPTLSIEGLSRTFPGVRGGPPTRAIELLPDPVLPPLTRPLAIAGPEELPVTESVYKEQFKPVLKCNPVVPPGFAELIEKCLKFNANKRPDRMSEVQGTLDQLADEAAAKCNPADLEE